MSCSSKADIFSALVKGDLDFIKGLHSDVDLNEYITLDTPAIRGCNCHVKFELFIGSAEEMLSTYGDAVATGKCDHCNGRPKASGNSQGSPNSGFFQYFHSRVTNNETDGGLNALQLAVHFGHKTIVEWLISAREGSIQSVTKHMKETPLNIAAIHGNVDMVQFLLENGAQINCYSELVNESPAQYATIFNHPDLLESLIEHGADINHKGNMYENPLATAFAANNFRCIELLLKAGVDAIGSQGGFMFRRALEQDNRELAALFLDYINVNDPLTDEGDDVKYTPLLVAVRLDDAEMVRLLVEKGANLDADVGVQYTVLNYAVYQDMFEMTKVLVELGCSVNHVNDTKYSPLHFAAWDGSHEICEVLLAHGLYS